jgi:hypothetical protein
MPKRGESRVIALAAAMSFDIKEIDKRQFRDAGYRDEIVNNSLMEIAIAQSSCL